MNMTDGDRLSRRKVLSTLGVTGLSLSAGCASVRERLGVDPSSAEAKPSNPPTPQIVDYIGEVALFRETMSKAELIAVLENTGVEGEFRITAKAMDGGAVYDTVEKQYSLRNGQQLQEKFMLFTHSGAEKVVVKIASTRFPGEYDQVILTGSDKKHINYE